MEDRDTEFVTIAEAARRMGVAARQARRWADKLAPKDKDNSRVPVLVSWFAIQAAQHESTQRDKDRDKQGQSPPPAAAAFALERIVTEQAARLAEQKALYEARISDLQAALDSEREARRQIADALAREQMLRALPAPVAEVPEAANLAVGSPETGDRANEEAEAGALSEAPTEAKIKASNDKPGWWARLWRR